MRDIINQPRVLGVWQLNSSDKSPHRNCRLVRFLDEDDNAYSVIIDNITGKDICCIETTHEAEFLIKFEYSLKK